MIGVQFESSQYLVWFKKKKCQRLELENNYDFFMNCHNTKGMHEKFIEYNNQFRNTLFDYTVVHV